MRAFSPATPPARRPTSVVAFNPASISGLRSRLLDANTFTSPIDSKYYLKDSSTENTHLPRQGRCYTFDGVNDYIAIASLAGSETVVSKNGTASLTISAGRIDATAGTLWDLVLSNGSRYYCNEESGTTAYDASGNAAHGTLTNITQATFHTASTSVTSNPNNVDGYRLSGSVYIPKRIGSSLAADGNALTVTGRAAYHGCAEVPCVTGNGSNVYVNLGTTFTATGDFEIEVLANISSSPANMGLIGHSTNGALFINDTISTRVFIAGVAKTFVTPTLTSGTTYLFRVTRVSSSLRLFINGTESSTGAISASGDFTFNQFMRSTTANYANGWIANVVFTTDGVTTYFPLQDGPGSSNTNRDIAWVKSDGTGGVVSSAIVNGTVSTIWGNRVPGNVEDWCVKYGGRIAANGAFVAGMLTGGNAADGSVKTLTAGKFGNPFSRLNLNPATAAELNGKNIQTAYEDLPCVTGNASNVYFSLGSLRIPVGDHTVSFWYYHDQSNTTSRRLFDVRVGSFLYIVLANHGVADRIVFYGKSVTFGSIDGLVVNAWNLITLTQASSSITCTLTKPDGSQVVSSPIAVVGEVDTSPIYLLGAYNNSGVPTLANPSAGRIANVSLTASGATTCFPLSDGSGADLAWYKSDGTKGVVSTALQGTLTNVWANKTDGSKVAATKYALRAIVTRETEFNRVASDGDDRFLIYDNALSGGNLTNVEGYVA